MNERQADADEDRVVKAQGLDPDVVAISTTRRGGRSLGPFATMNLGDHVGDDASDVSANRALLQPRLPGKPHWLAQVHGTTVHDADALAGAPVTPNADAAVTATPETVLAILTADCLPVVLYGKNHQILGVAHAGWRGLADGVLNATVEAMRRKAGVPLTWGAWIGPCVGPQAYQVGSQVRERFVELDQNFASFFRADPRVPQKWWADLPAIALHQLRDLGATDASWCGLCTATDAQNRFFSYRRDGMTGRMATLAWLLPTVKKGLVDC